MNSLSALCLDLFLLGHAHLEAGQAGQGAAFERRVRGHLDVIGQPDARGFRVFGRRSLSGIYHQLDEQTACTDALVVGEWKAYTGQIPKNDLLRFKAATDDYWLGGTGRFPAPVMRIFGGTGSVTDSMRVYAAHWGIVLVTPDRWPVPAVADPDLLWAPGDLSSPGAVDRRTLTSLVRPLSDVLAPMPDGSWRLAPMASSPDIAARLGVWEHWSERAWEWWDDASRGRFDSLMSTRVDTLRGIAA